MVSPLAVPRRPKWLNRVNGLAALALAVAAWNGPVSVHDPWLITGCLLWLLTTLGLALGGLISLWRTRRLEVGLMGLLYAPVGGIWSLAYASQGSLMGFDASMTLLTAVHFCYVTLGAMQWAQRASQQLTEQPFLKAFNALLMGAPALVAVGITYSFHQLGPSMAAHSTVPELAAVSLQVLATSGISLVWLIQGASRVPLRWKAGLQISAAFSLLTMGLALNYACGRYFGLPHLDLSWMIPYHGMVNALGFVTLGLWTWNQFASTPVLAGSVK